MVEVSRQRQVSLAMGAFLIACAGGARADDVDASAATTVWRCWYNAPEHVSCLTPRAAHRFLHIPLHDVPFDMDGPRELARSIMCGTDRRCSVAFSARAPAADELDLAFDPVLAGDSALVQ